MRKQVAILLGENQNIDTDAFKYFVLSTNPAQELFEFSFPDTSISIFKSKGSVIHEKTVEHLKAQVSKSNLQDEYDYWIAIINNKFSSNYFFRHEQNYAVITTDVWEKSFTPPSVFEYLFQSIVTCLLYFDTCKDLKSHSATTGCLMDLTRNKIDDKINILTGYICSNHRKVILSNSDENYLDSILDLLKYKWLGQSTEFGSVSYNLRHVYNFDINKDSGFEKSFFKRVKEDLHKLPFDFINSVFKLLVGVAIAYIIYRLELK